MRLEARGLKVESRAGPAIVRGVDLTVQAGRVTALVGGSGAGKSLACLALQGAVPPGARIVGGAAEIVEGAARRPARPGRDMAAVLQNPRSAFNPVRRIGAHARETPGAGPRFAEALAEVGLDPVRTPAMYAFEMSGGMLQRAMIALALASGAPFLIADEPTTDLDLVAQARLLDLLERLAAQRGLGVLLVTHDMGVVARLADDIVVMEAGRVVETGDAAALFARPRHPATRALRDAHLALAEPRR